MDAVRYPYKKSDKICPNCHSAGRTCIEELKVRTASCADAVYVGTCGNCGMKWQIYATKENLGKYEE